MLSPCCSIASWFDAHGSPDHGRSGEQGRDREIFVSLLARINIRYHLARKLRYDTTAKQRELSCIRGLVGCCFVGPILEA